MIIVPPLNTRERAESDLNDLKNTFIRCQDLGISKDIQIRKYVCKLKEAAGKEGFSEMFRDFFTLVETKRHHIDVSDEKTSNSIFIETEPYIE